MAAACGSLLLTVILLFSGHTAFAASRPHSTQSEPCILCHADLFNTGLKQNYIHAPFFDRQCVVCHLSDGSQSGGGGLLGASAAAVDEPASQESQWREPVVYRDEWQSLDHLVQIPGLQDNTVYRYRVAIGSQPELALSTSVWKGLQLSDFPVATNGPAEILQPISRDEAIVTEVQSIKLVRLASGSVLFSWDTSRPFYAWIELQKLAGPNLTALASAGENVTQPAVVPGSHPLLREPEELAIDACFQCHTDSEMGTSHPVRLYNGDGVRIPDELPTVAGMLTCVTCHDPHGSVGRMLIRETIKTRLCVACHYTLKNSSPSTMFN